MTNNLTRQEGRAAKMLGLSQDMNPYRAPRLRREHWDNSRFAELASLWDSGYLIPQQIQPETTQDTKP